MIAFLFSFNQAIKHKQYKTIKEYYKTYLLIDYGWDCLTEEFKYAVKNDVFPLHNNHSFDDYKYPYLSEARQYILECIFDLMENDFIAACYFIDLFVEPVKFNIKRLQSKNYYQLSYYEVNNIKKEKDKLVIKYNNEDFKLFASGNTRKVYVNKNKTFVIKVPVNKLYNLNINEYNVYKNSKDKQYYAECKLIENNWLLMEYIDPIIDNNFNYPEWVGNIKQVGFDKNKNLKFYDYPIEIILIK